jgi:hypothetical protein
MQLLVIKSKIAKAFDNIGRTNGTATPQSADNRFSTVYEYFVAAQLASAADKRKEKAKAALQEAGILDKSKCIVGSTVVLYEHELGDFVAKTANPAERLDKTLLKNELIKAIGAEKAEKIITAATKFSAPATSYDFVVK